METTRQQKIARQIQKDISDILLKEAVSMVKGVMVSVTTVRVSPDLSFARIYLSIFPFNKNQEILDSFQKNNWMIRKALGSRMRNQVKQVPEIDFRLDDSLEYIENIDHLLKEE